jgi:hypothetical protein
MPSKPAVDVQQAHRYFSAHCFNRAWDYIDKTDRTPEDDRTMLQLALASLWHWTQRDDRKPENLSVGYWQVSRVYALLKLPGPARTYGQLSLDEAQTEGVGPFYLGYAYEALARAESVAGERAKAEDYLSRARAAAEKVAEARDQKALLADLATILEKEKRE